MLRYLSLLAACFTPLALAQTYPNFDAQISAAHPLVRLDFNDATINIRDQVSGLNFLPSSAGTIHARQPGFDLSNASEKSASFTFDSYLTAPNNSLGHFEWNQPFSIHYTVDGLPLVPAVLLSKGPLVNVPYNGMGYDLAWDGVGGLCFQLATHGSSGNTSLAQCTDQIPTGYNLDIWVTYDGTGQCGTAAHIYVNGVDVQQGSFSDPWHDGCSDNHPTSASSMVSDGPLYVPGNSSSGGGGWGGGGAPLRLDEVDVFSGVVDRYTIASTFLHTKFYQSLINQKPAIPVKVIISEDGCGDVDNLHMIELAIAAHKLGYIKILALTSSLNSGAVGFYRQMLDSAGLNHVPVSRTAAPIGQADANVCQWEKSGPTYNASTDFAWTNYPSAPTIYRQIIASLKPGEKIAMVYGGAYTDLAEFMQAPADNLSILSGEQMFANSIAFVNFQGMKPPPVLSGVWGDNGMIDWTSAEYVVTHNGTVPLNWYGGTPIGTGGLLFTRPAKDPMVLAETAMGGAARSCWDCLPLLGLITNAFQGEGVEVALVYTQVPDVVESTSSTSNIFFYPFSAPYLDPNEFVYQWFVDSLVNTVSQGQPRGAQ